jgi:hypothetical protein
LHIVYPVRYTAVMTGDWVLAVRGPLSQLEQLCNTRPASAPVKFVPKMANACERLGLVTEVRHAA